MKRQLQGIALILLGILLVLLDVSGGLWIPNVARSILAGAYSA